jgi:predicted amidohydrolase YtcJ
MPYLRLEQAALIDMLKPLMASGIRPRIHAVGNEAASTVGAALAEIGCRTACIEHLTFLADKEIDMVADTGAVASLQPGFIERFGAGVVDRGLVPRLRAYPAASLLRAGVPLALSSDNPCGPLDPLANIRSAVSRRTQQDLVVDAREALSLEEAVSAYTTGGYQAIHGRPGQGLSVGAPADFVVIDNDLLTRDASVCQTWIKGARVWSRH